MLSLGGWSRDAYRAYRGLCCTQSVNKQSNSHTAGKRLAVEGDMPGQDCDAFFGGLERARRRVMGDRKHYCKLDPRQLYPERQQTVKQSHSR
jgi:hypothetical protein